MLNIIACLVLLALSILNYKVSQISNLSGLIKLKTLVQQSEDQSSVSKQMAKFMKKFFEDRKNQMVQSYYVEVLETEKFREKEKLAAVIIQKIIKASKFRHFFQYFKQATITIQRIFRGFFARINFMRLINAKLSKERQQMYSSHARSIQRIYRGFYSRKYIHDFTARKQYLTFIKIKDEQLRIRLQQYQQTQQKEESQRQAKQARTQFGSFVNKLHYLTSTKNIPGVYKHIEGVYGMGKSSRLLISKDNDL